MLMTDKREDVVWHDARTDQTQYLSVASSSTTSAVTGEEVTLTTVACFQFITDARNEVLNVQPQTSITLKSGDWFVKSGQKQNI